MWSGLIHGGRLVRLLFFVVFLFLARVDLCQPAHEGDASSHRSQAHDASDDPDRQRDGERSSMTGPPSG